MKLESYWLATAPTFSGAQTDLPAAADVVVIGGGFTGCSAALSLARAGVDVVLLEAKGIASQASGRNGGHCNTGVAQDFSGLAASVGLDRAKRYYRAYADAVDYVERVVAEQAIDCDFVRLSKLKLARKAKHFPSLAASAEALRTHVGAKVEVISAVDIRNEIASDAFHGGLLQHGGGQMHMGRFAHGLAKSAAAHGARLYTDTPVTGLTRLDSGTRYRIQTARGEIVAERVLLATGCSNQGPFGWFQRRIVPVGSFVIVTEPLTDAQIDAALPGRRTYVTTLNLGNYFRLTADRRLVFGGRARFALSNPASDARSGEILRQSLRELLPSLANVQAEYCWGGLVEATVDRLPHAGQHDGLYYSLGYSGHGTQMAVFMGDLMADRLLGRDRANPWARDTWHALPGHVGKPWFLPLAGAYYKMKDVFF